MEHEETECQAPDVPILCVNNCGFFGSAATMNMCSKCHRDMVLSQRQAELAASSIDTIMNGGSRGDDEKEAAFLDDINLRGTVVDYNVISTQLSDVSSSSKDSEVKAKQGPTRCNTCKKRVGLTGFNCRCGHIFCAAHRYSDKHGCQFDFRTAAQDAIAKANPVVKAEKLDKI